MFAYLCLFLLPLLLLYTFFELLLQCLFFLLLAFNKFLFLLHNLLEPIKILIYLLYPLFAFLRPLILAWHLVVEVLYPQLHLQSTWLLLLFLQFASSNLKKHFVHLLIGDLAYPILEYFSVELFFVYLVEKIGIIGGKIPKGPLLDIFGYLTHNLFVADWIGVVSEQLLQYFGVSCTIMLHLI